MKAKSPVRQTGSCYRSLTLLKGDGCPNSKLEKTFSPPFDVRVAFSKGLTASVADCIGTIGDGLLETCSRALRLWREQQASESLLGFLCVESTFLSLAHDLSNKVHDFAMLSFLANLFD